VLVVTPPSVSAVLLSSLMSPFGVKPVMRNVLPLVSLGLLPQSPAISGDANRVTDCKLRRCGAIDVECPRRRKRHFDDALRAVRKDLISFYGGYLQSVARLEPASLKRKGLKVFGTSSLRLKVSAIGRKANGKDCIRSRCMVAIIEEWLNFRGQRLNCDSQRFHGCGRCLLSTLPSSCVNCTLLS